MTVRFLLPALLFLLSTGVRAQQPADDTTFLLEASKAVEADRYLKVKGSTYRSREIQGSPYRYPTFGPVILYDLMLNAYALDSANLNGYSNRFEYYDGDELRELATTNFIRAEVPDREGGTHLYVRGGNPKFPKRFAEIVYEDDQLRATVLHHVINDKRELQDVGKTLILESFVAKRLHFATLNGEVVAVALNPKKLATVLGHRQALLAFMKKEKLKPSRRADLIRIYEKTVELMK